MRDGRSSDTSGLLGSNLVFSFEFLHVTTLDYAFCGRDHPEDPQPCMSRSLVRRATISCTVLNPLRWKY